MTVALSMIIKNEPIDRLAMLVDYLKPVVSQFSIADTGSDSFEQDAPLIRSWGVHLTQYEWKDNFAHARNSTLDYIDADWTLHLDADELPTLGMMEAIVRIDESCDPETLGWLFFTRNFWGGELGSEMEAHWHTRLFRTKHGMWYKKLHEQVMLDGKREEATRGKVILPKANKDAYLIHSKPREMIEVSAALYERMSK